MMSASLIGSANPAWRGGPPEFICAHCGKTRRRYFTTKSAARRFCDSRCYRAARSGPGNPKWRGGRALKSAYIRVRLPDHPRADSWGYVDEHVVVAERALGKHLPAGAVVHHVDVNRRNNAPTNLVICQDAAYHKLLHARLNARRRSA